MKTFEKSSVLVMAVLALTVLLYPGPQVEAQHGASSSDEHFEALATRLELTDAQKDKLKAPVGEAVAAIQTLHRLHDEIAADLSEEQQQRFATLLHDALGTMAAGEGDHGHNRHR